MKCFKPLAMILLLVNIFGFSVNTYAKGEMSRVWVEFDPPGMEKAKQALINTGAELHYQFDELSAFAVSVPTKAIQGLSKNPNIISIEEDGKRYPSTQQVPYGIDAVQARDVWDADRDNSIDSGSPTGSGRMICVIDSGLKVDHEDFAGVNITGGYPSDWSTDSCGHGTHVAGTITAANNGKGVVGVSPGATSLYIVKVFDGSDCGWTYSSDLVDAAQRCEAAGANIISMSLGGSVRSRTEQRAFGNIENAGLLSIAAAGNDGNKTKSYPASYNSVISVAAVDSNNIVADFSQTNSAVELSAPGVNVLSTVPWIATNTITVDGSVYSGQQIENAASASVAGSLVNGGLCDTAGSWSGKIVLCERGDISFYDKVMNVQNGGGIATVIYNNVSGGFSGTLDTGNSSVIPAISLSQADGELLLTKIDMAASLVSSFTSNASGYEAWDGTSMATPHVSGVAALVWSASPSSTNAEIRAALTSTAMDLGNSGKDNAYGYGLVQAYDAWVSMGSGGGNPNTSPTAIFSVNCTDLDCTYDASASTDSDGSIVSYSWDFGDGSSGSGEIVTHSYANAGSFAATLTVTDDGGASNTAIQTINVSDGGGSGDTTPPVISSLTASKDKGTRFVIEWTTDEPATSVVEFACCGVFTNTALVTSHKISFRGSKGQYYEFWVSSTDASGNTSEPVHEIFQN